MGLLSQIAGALGSSSTSTPTVRKPVFAVQFGSGSGDDWAHALTGFSTICGMAPFVDTATIDVASGTGPSSATGDSGSISAGYDDTSAGTIFTGKVEAVRYGVAGVTRVRVSKGAAPLSRLRLNQSYEQRSAADIVNDLTQKASVDTGSVEDGAKYPFYVIDDRRTAWQHIAALARSNGFAAYFTTDGKLNFGPVAEGQPVQTFTYGDDILGLQLTRAVPAAGQVTVTGEGAAGSKGSDAWNWLLKDVSAVKAQSGTGDVERLFSDGSVRSSDAAQAASDQIAAAVTADALSGWLLAPGSPDVTVGSTIALAGAPQDALNGNCIVERVHHRFRKNQGFTTLIHFTQSSQASGGGGGLLGSAVSAVKGLL